MTNKISLEDRKWYRVSSLYSNKHKTIINTTTTTTTTFDVTKGSPWYLVSSLVTHKFKKHKLVCSTNKQTLDIIKSTNKNTQISWANTN